MTTPPSEIIHRVRRRQLTPKIRRLLAAFPQTTPPQEVDQTWNAWLNEGRSSTSLRELLSSSAREEFKARAIAVLLIPDFRLLPFQSRFVFESESPNYLNMFAFSAESCPAPLRLFAAEVLYECVKFVVEDGRTDFIQALTGYNELILQFLAFLPEKSELAVKLFSYFRINDVKEYRIQDERTGYRPFGALLSNTRVHEKWKRLADEQMREHVTAELTGQAKPRVEWEEALPLYVAHVYTANGGQILLYSDELFASQLDWLLSLPDIDRQATPIFSSEEAHKLMRRLLFRGNNRVLCHRLVRHVVLHRGTDGNPTFSVNHGGDRTFAENILDEFGDQDPELHDRLPDLLESYKTRCQEAEQYRRGIAAREQKLLAAMG